MPSDEKQRIRDEESVWKNRKEEEGGGEEGNLEPDWFEEDLDELEDEEDDDDDE